MKLIVAAAFIRVNTVTVETDLKSKHHAGLFMAGERGGVAEPERVGRSKTCFIN